MNTAFGTIDHLEVAEPTNKNSESESIRCSDVERALSTEQGRNVALDRISKPGQAAWQLTD